MHCNGKCILMKKLKQAEKEEEKQIPPLLKEKSDVSYWQNLTNFSICLKIYFEDKQQSIFDYIFQYSISYHTDVFHPPNFNLI